MLGLALKGSTWLTRTNSAGGPVISRRIVALCGFAAGCASPMARLDGVLVDVRPDLRPATPMEYSRARVLRGGRVVAGGPQTAIGVGDSLVTAGDGMAVLTMAGHEVIVEPGTTLVVGSASIVVRVGQVVVTRQPEARGSLTITTEVGALGSEGKQFVVVVRPDQSAEITVLEGRVTVTARGPRGWPSPVAYVGGERGGWIANGLRLTPTEPVPGPDAESLRRRIGAVARVMGPELPNVIGMPDAGARTELERHGFRVAVNAVVTRKGPVGTVVGTSPSAGSRLRVGDEVRIDTEALPPDPSRSVAGDATTFGRVTVPNVVGQTFESAARILAGAGLLLGDTVTVVEINAGPGTVSFMSPAADVFVRPGSRVNLKIARSPAAGRSTCRVPNLLRLDERDARAAVVAARLSVCQVTLLTGGAVTNQTPVAGSSVVCGAGVSFVVGSRMWSGQGAPGYLALSQ